MVQYSQPENSISILCHLKWKSCLGFHMFSTNVLFSNPRFNPESYIAFIYHISAISHILKSVAVPQYFLTFDELNNFRDH